MCQSRGGIIVLGFPMQKKSGHIKKDYILGVNGPCDTEHICQIIQDKYLSESNS